MLVPEPGTVIAERFELERLAGSGGMGLVYRARDRVTDRPVALKLIAGGARQKERFAREAAILAELRHGAIVDMVAHGTAGERRWLAMEWVDGPTLSERLEQGRLSVAETVVLGVRLAEALGVAHRRGVVHRDVKPSNIVLAGGALEGCKLLDFGVARWVEEGEQLTVTGELVGSPAYMSPEQCRGARAILPASDVFSLASVLYECLTGTQAFGAPRVHSVMAKVLFDSPAPLAERCPGAPAGLAALLERMFAKEPAERPADGAAVAAALRAQDGAAVAAAPPPTRIGEKRLVSVVLARAPAPFAGGEPGWGGATIESLRDGTLLAVLRSDGDATELCVRAARLAQRLQRRAPEATVAVATARTTVTGARPASEVFEAAARLAAAGDGAIHLDEVTGSLLETRFDVRGGVLRAERTEIRAVRGRTLPCLGREPELAVLEAAYAQCVDESVARAYLVTAPPGVGKSRLAAELVGRLRGARRPPSVWTGTGDPMRAGTPYGILARATRRGLGLGDEDPIAAVHAAIEDDVGAAFPPAERARVAGCLGELVGAPFADPGAQLRAARHDAGLTADLLARAWRDWLAARCRRAPVVMVLEDLHWGDVPTVKIVESALQERDQPFLVLALARPDVHAAFPGLWAKVGASELRLVGLSRRVCERLAAEALGSAATPRAVERIAAAAEGNPFYLEELVRASFDGTDTTLPESILAIVQARLEALPDRARRLLRAASVLGQSFTPAAAGALLPELGTAELGELLEELVAAEVLVRRGLVYGFRHALLHDGAYASLPDADRRHAHRLAAEQLAARPDADPLVLAEHFEHGGEPERAVEHFRAAAEAALRAADLDGAMARAAQGIDCGATGETLAGLWSVQAEALAWRGDADDEARALAEQALELLAPASQSWFRALDTLGILTGRAGAYPRVIEILDELIARPSEGATARAHARALISCLAELSLGGLRQAAEPGLRRLDEVFAAIPGVDPGILAWRRQLEAFIAMSRGDFGTTRRAYEAAIAAFRELGDVANLCSNEQNLAFMLVEMGDYAGAEAKLRRLFESREMAGSVDVIARQNLGLALARQGKLDEARRMLEGTIADFTRHGQLRAASLSHVYLAQAHLWAGDAEAADEHAAQGVELSAEIPSVQPFALGVLAECRLAQGRVDEALAAATAATKLAAAEGGGGLPEGEAVVRAAYAEALAAAGRGEEAHAVHEAARVWLQARAALLEDGEERRRFLEDVRENARILG